MDNEIKPVTLTTRMPTKDATLMVTVPADAIKRLKTANLIGKKYQGMPVQCFVSLIPDDYDFPDSDDLF